MVIITKIPEFSIGDWVEVNMHCLIGQYIGRIVQVVDFEESHTTYNRFEYTCNITDDHDQIFWEHELTLSKVIPINGMFPKDRNLDNKKDIVVTKEPEEKPEEEPKVIWV